MDRELLVEKITSFRNSITDKKPLKETTIETYADRVLLLFEEFSKKKKLITYLNNSEQVIKDIKYKYSSIASLSTVIYSVIAVIEAIGGKKEAIEQYSKEFNIIKEKLNNKEKLEKSPQEEENWMTQEEIHDTVVHLKVSIENSSGKELFNNFQDYLLVSLYTLIPPVRNNFVDITVIEQEPKEIDKKMNYIILSTKQMILNEYKTSGTYGTSVSTLPDELIKIIRRWIEVREAIYPQLKGSSVLLYNKKDLIPMKRRNVSKYFNRIFEKKVSVSMLRKIYISTKYPVSHLSSEMEKDAKLMGHSVNTQQFLYRKR